jgi:hypothetical protein
MQKNLPYPVFFSDVTRGHTLWMSGVFPYSKDLAPPQSLFCGGTSKDYVLLEIVQVTSLTQKTTLDQDLSNQNYGPTGSVDRGFSKLLFSTKRRSWSGQNGGNESLNTVLSFCQIGPIAKQIIQRGPNVTSFGAHQSRTIYAWYARWMSRECCASHKITHEMEIGRAS